MIEEYEEKVIQMGAPFTFFNVNIPPAVATDLSLEKDSVLVWRKTIIDDGLTGKTTIGYTIETKPV